MDKIQVESLEKGVVICFTHDLFFSKDTNVLYAEKYWALTRLPESLEPSVHEITLLILDEKWREVQNHQKLINCLKSSYGKNLVALIDLEGNKL